MFFGCCLWWWFVCCVERSDHCCEDFLFLSFLFSFRDILLVQSLGVIGIFAILIYSFFQRKIQ